MVEFIDIAVSVLLQDKGEIMFNLRLTEKIVNRDVEYYLSGIGLNSVVHDLNIKGLNKESENRW